MATYFVINTDLRGNAASDSNDGLDALGAALTAATFTTSTKNLNQTGLFSGYAWQADDLIYISGGTGVTAGLYEIASKTDDDNIVLVSDIGGTDPSDVTSSSGPFLTPQKGADTGTSGDQVRYCADATFAVNAQVDFDTNAGTAGAPIVHEGYNSRGVTRATATVKVGTFSTSTEAVFKSNTTADYIVWQNFVLDGALTGGANNADNCLEIENSTACIAINCEAKNATNYGFQFDGNKGKAINCQAHDISGGAAQAGFLLKLDSIVYKCSAYDNGEDGFVTGGNHAHFVQCEAYGNTESGFNIGNAFAILTDCTSYGNTLHGYEQNALHVTYVNCSASTNSQYGFQGSADYDTPASMLINCHTYNNTSGATNDSRGFASAELGTGNVTGDPLWTAPGTDDFTIDGVASPLYNAGIMGNGDHIGALGRKATAAGGGGTKLVGFGGGIIG